MRHNRTVSAYRVRRRAYYTVEYLVPCSFLLRRADHTHLERPLSPPATYRSWPRAGLTLPH